MTPRPNLLFKGWSQKLWWVIGCGWAFAVAPAESVRIATYNVQNYVSTDRMTDAGYRQDYPKPEVEKQALRQVIRGLGADVLVLQEMGTAEYLEELQRDLKKEGLDYPQVVLLVANDADRHVALLSKLKILSVVQHTALEFTYFGGKEKVKRGLLEVQFSTSAGKLTLFGLHLKSRITDRADDPMATIRRTGEATAMRDLVGRRFPEASAALFVVLGDFNDDKSSKAVRRFLVRGKTATMTLLPAADSRGETWTHAYRKEDNYSRMDHLLFSPALVPYVEGGRASIYDGPGSLVASDHRAVVATLRFPDKK
jgi:endonuclease/exonuclease/phosphatase family metal-dependent hydrolase